MYSKFYKLQIPPIKNVPQLEGHFYRFVILETSTGFTEGKCC